jgi:NAD(P)-dependent dehydrogenase (short-subunit alcohol dehydrogenase family)
MTEPQQQPLGTLDAMRKAADDGEDSYRGIGRVVGRPGRPKELAGVYVLLASDEGSYMSGSVVPVTGGRPIR